MIRLTIDDKPVEVEENTTILQAARQLGITIPTLCHCRDLKPATACLVCLVAIDGRERLTPSCSALVHEGMHVRTGTPEVIQARSDALALLLSEHAGDCLAPCQLACPRKIDIPRMIRCIQAGNFDQALAVIRYAVGDPDGTLCQQCKKPCEAVCRRRLHDEPVAIAQLILAARTFGNPQSGNRPVQVPPPNPASASTLRDLTASEIEIFVEQASPAGRTRPDRPDAGLSRAAAQKESMRCMHCDCRKQQGCALRHLADAYAVKKNMFRGERLAFKQQRYQHYIYEPGKCIKCGICTRLSEKAGIPAGFTFFQRGFNVSVNVPYGDYENEPLMTIIDQCIDLCPTGALCRNDRDASGACG